MSQVAKGQKHFHTTIKVTSELRDRLKVQADANGLTLGEQLSRLVEAAEREARLDAMAEAMAATPPEEMASYLEEVEFWDRITP